MKPNRIVALVTPVAALAAGACATWLAQHFPGIDIKQSDLQSVFVAGAVVALAPAAQWLHGWQKFEAREADAANAIKLGTIAAPPAPAPVAATDAALDDLGEVDDLDSLDDVDEFDDELLAEDDELVGTAD
ncbi:MAG TPA: hypothetical protein VF032_00710 [Thermoleophilaceae bacterium]